MNYGTVLTIIALALAIFTLAVATATLIATAVGVYVAHKALQTSRLSLSEQREQNSIDLKVMLHIGQRTDPYRSIIVRAQNVGANTAFLSRVGFLFDSPELQPKWREALEIEYCSDLNPEVVPPSRTANSGQQINVDTLLSRMKNWHVSSLTIIGAYWDHTDKRYESKPYELRASDWEVEERVPRTA